MQVTVDRKAFADALTAVRSVIETRNTIPILGNIAVTVAGDGAVSVRGTDLDIELTVQMAPTIGATAGTTTLPGSMLTDYIRKAASESVTLIESNGRCGIHAGRGKSVLNTLPHGDFPTLSGVGEGAVTFTLPTAHFARLFALTQFAISTEETRYYLNGVYLHMAPGPDGKELAAVATDGHRLSRVAMAAPVEAMTGGIVPRKTVATILKLLPKEGNVTVSIDESKIRLTWAEASGAVSLVSKLIDGTFPDYERVIPKTNTMTATINRAALIAGADLVQTIATERGRAIKCVFAEGNPLVLEVTNVDSGNAREEVECTFEGSDAATEITIGINGRYVRDAADTLEGRDIAIALSDPGSPMLLTNHPDTNHLIVLMPMRV